jgi:hypothetical protein
MRSPFVWWCKRQYQSFRHLFNTDWQFRAATIVLAVELAALAYYASASFWLGAFIKSI